MFELVGAVLLIVPAAVNWMPALTSLATAALACEALALAALYARHSLKLVAATNAFGGLETFGAPVDCNA